MEMKEEALALADYLDNNVEAMLFTEQPHLDRASAMIRRLVEELDGERRKAKAFRQSNEVADTQIKALVEELDKKKPLSDEEIDNLIVDGGHLDCVLDYHSAYDELSVLKFELKRIARAIEERHGIK